jgi:hypothetical protein
LLAAAQLIGALYYNMHDFEVFTALSQLYFAAASYSETARRLNRPHLAQAFLLSTRKPFASQFRACLQAAKHNLSAAQKATLLQQIRETIEPINVAGWSDLQKRNWYRLRPLTCSIRRTNSNRTTPKSSSFCSVAVSTRDNSSGDNRRRRFLCYTRRQSFEAQRLKPPGERPCEN